MSQIARKLSFTTLVVVAALALGGCAFFAKPKGMAAVDGFQPGVTTIKQAMAVLGRPQSVATQANGASVLGWLHTTPSPLGAANQGVTILFAADGRMVRVLQRYENVLGY